MFGIELGIGYLFYYNAKNKHCNINEVLKSQNIWKVLQRTN